jgi:hypothetical protein
MTSLNRMKERLDQLIAKGESVLRSEYGPNFEWVKRPLFQEWRTGCCTFLDRVFGDGSLEFTHFVGCCNMNSVGSVQNGLAVLHAVKEDLEFGAIGRLEEMVSSAIYSDFLSIAQGLLNQEQAELLDMAAFLVSAVLENGLRQIARNHDVKVRESDDISTPNHKLADAKNYNDLCRKKILVWNTIRSNADHGRFGRNSPSDVANMLEGVRDFLAEFLRS